MKAYLENPQCECVEQMKNLKQKLEKERPALIEKAMEQEKCHILICFEAKRPANVESLYFNSDVLDKGYGWGKLHKYDTYWIGSRQTNNCR